MALVDDDVRRSVALFRFRVIAEVLSEPPARAGARVRAQAEKVWVIPGSRRTRVAPQTIRDWIRLYRASGFEGLLPKPRADQAKPRRMPPEVIEVVLSIKREAPGLSVRKVIERAREGGEVPDSIPLPPSTLHRLFSREGLMVREQVGPGQELRRFSFAFAGDLWTSDAMHGPRAGDGRGNRRKTRLLATLDDASRVCPYGAFGFSERTPAFLQVLREAVLRRGIPVRLYVDNGATFRSQQLELICAKLGIALIHARPFHPAGRGKIERWFRTVRSQFLASLEEQDTRDLETLNRRFRAWVEGEYHRTPHRGLDNLTPLDKWAECGERVRYPGPEIDLEDLFLFEAKRRVSKARTVSLHNRLYEVDAGLDGQRVVLRFDPLAPPQRPLKVVHDGKPAGEAKLLDLYGNARVKRRGSNPLSFRALDDPEDD